MLRWILIILLMCNGIYFLWQSYLTPKSHAVVPVVAATQGGAEQQLVLLSEASTERVESETAVGRPEVAAAEELVATGTAKVSNSCWLIGPFKEEVSSKQLLARMAALDISLSSRRVEIEGDPDYWVHLPPQVSRRAAIKLLRELQNKKIDSFLITEGDLANGISLGFFTQQARAEKVYQQRVDQGYEPIIKIVPRTRTETWVMFDSRENGEFSDQLWKKVQQGNPGLERHKNYCDKIASVDNFD